METEMKKCSKCRTLQPLKQFCARKTAGDGRDGWCRSCKKRSAGEWRKRHPKQIAAYRREWRRTHRSLVVAEKKRYRQKHPARARRQVRDAHRRRGKIYRARRYFTLIENRYGITKTQIQAQARQQKNRCAVCHQKQKCGKRRRLYADHDHETKKFRGLICFSCNAMLGFSKDNLETLRSAIYYLSSSKLFA